MKLLDKNQTATRSLMMQIFYNVTHSSFRRRPQTVTQQRKQTFSNSLGCSRNCFLVFCKEFMWKMTYMHFTDRIICYSLYKWHGKENNLARDPICLWLRSLYGYWLRILFAISYFYNL